MRPMAVGGLLGAAISMGLCSRAWPGAAADDPVTRDLVRKAVAFIRQQLPDNRIGESALAGLALVKAGVPVGDPAVRLCLNKVRTAFADNQYVARRPEGLETYEAAVVALFLTAVGPDSYRPEIAALGRFLLDRQNPNGSWDYYPRRRAGDTSITQYGLLALWELYLAGLDVPSAVWARAAEWHLASQHPSGGFPYHPDEYAAAAEDKKPSLKLSLTAGALGSLLICQRQLERPAAEAAPARLQFADAPEAAEGPRLGPPIATAIAKGKRFLTQYLEFRKQTQIVKRDGLWVEQGPTQYWLYSLERFASLAGSAPLGSVDWYGLGRDLLQREQNADGSWEGGHGKLVDTSFGVLFLCRAMGQSLERVQARLRLMQGGNLLAGGRGMPTVLEAAADARPAGWYRPYTSPLKKSADELLLALSKDQPEEDPEALLASLMALVDQEGPAVVDKHAERLIQLAGHEQARTRRAALWLLSRSGRLEFVPVLIQALEDPDVSVYRQARDGLRFLSRRPEGFGLPDAPTAEQRAAGIRKWQAWYQSVRADVPMGAP